MNIQDVLAKLELIKARSDLSVTDSSLVLSLINYLEPKDLLATLSTEDKLEIKNAFDIRWSSIKDTELDYFAFSGEVNALWVDLAQTVFVDSNYLQILVPSITNQFDPNDLSRLSETRRLENFFLSDGDKFLYRKRSFCELLIKNRGQLALKRDMHSDKLSPLTVMELMRLQSCHQPNASFKVDDESFDSFWDFLGKKVFIHLNEQNVIPEELMGDFLQLAGQYFKAKQYNNPAQFTQAMQLFLTQLYKNPLKIVNEFYGLTIEHENTTHYLFEFLIAIQKSNAFTVDALFVTLAKWIFDNIPHLSLDKIQLGLNTDVLEAKSKEKMASSTLLAEVSESDALYRCFKLITSLMTFNFRLAPLSGEQLQFWDWENKVPREGKIIFDQLKPLINGSSQADPRKIYEHIITVIIAPALHNSVLLKYLRPTTNSWLERIYNGTFFDEQPKFYEPEHLFIVLKALLASDLKNKQSVIYFLNELIHTCTQNDSSIAKKLRINILFVDLLKKLDMEKHKLIYNKLSDSIKGDIKQLFVLQCHHYIESQLEELVVPTKYSFRFFQQAEADSNNSPKITLGPSNVISSLVISFKEQVHKADLTPEMKRKMTQYLVSLSSLILTAEINEQLDEMTTGNDVFFGNFT